MSEKHLHPLPFWGYSSPSPDHSVLQVYHDADTGEWLGFSLLFRETADSCLDSLPYTSKSSFSMEKALDIINSETQVMGIAPPLGIIWKSYKR